MADQLADQIPLRRALVSVYDKTGLEALVRGLHDAGVALVSTGGSAALIEGLGLPVTQPSLGLLIANGFQFMLSGRSWISVYPGVALMLTVLAINLVGDQLRQVLNPKRRR